MELTNYDPSMMYSLSQIDRSVDSDRHHQCTRQDCVAYQISEATYQTAHTEACGGLDCRWLGAQDLHKQPPFPSIFSKIGLPGKLRTMPMAIYQNGELKYVSVSLAYGISTRITEHWHLPLPVYVAVSHVWADGLGK